MWEALGIIASNATNCAPPEMPWTVTEQDIDTKTTFIHMQISLNVADNMYLFY